MDSLVTSLLLALLAIKSKDSRFLYVASIGCVTSEFIYMFVDDVVMYYSLLSMLAATLGLKALEVDNIPSRIYTLLMIVQSLLCYLLIPSFSRQFNHLIESMIVVYNTHMLSVVFILAVAGSDNFITRVCNESKNKRQKQR